MSKRLLLNVDKDILLFLLLEMPYADTNDNTESGGDAELQIKVERASAIIQQYEDKIRAMIRFHVNDHSNIDDIFQDFFLSMVQNPVPFGIEDISGYLYKAITNDVIDMSRRAKRYRKLNRRYAENRRRRRISDDPQKIAIRLEERRRVIELIEEQLPACQAKALLERHDRDNSVRCTAEKMQISRRSLSRYLCLGLKRIRQFLYKEGEISDFG